MKLAKILPLGVIPSSVILIILNTLLYDTKTVLSKYYVILSTVTSSLETLSVYQTHIALASFECGVSMMYQLKHNVG